MIYALLFFICSTGFWMLAWLSAVSREKHRTGRVADLPVISAIPAAFRRGVWR